MALLAFNHRPAGTSPAVPPAVESRSVIFIESSEQKDDRRRSVGMKGAVRAIKIIDALSIEIIDGNAVS